MAVCDVCKKRFRLRRLNRRLAVPEYRAMIGFWPWIAIRVCDACVSAHDRDFLDRLRLLAPDVLENDEPIVRRVCLACGTVRSSGRWHPVSKWLDAQGRPVRRGRFYLCAQHRDEIYIDGTIASTNLTDAGQMGRVLDELPTAGADLLQRVEGWRPGAANGPPEAEGLALDVPRGRAVAEALAFWLEAPTGFEAKAAVLGPVRRDYRLRYRLDLVRDLADGRRERLVVVRTGQTVRAGGPSKTDRTAGAADRFATYRKREQQPNR